MIYNWSAAMLESQFKMFSQTNRTQKFFHFLKRILELIPAFSHVEPLSNWNLN